MSGCAWVTLATNDTYCLGALVLAHSLRGVSTRHELAIIITPSVSQCMREQLSKVFNVVHLVDVLDSQDAANLALLQRPDLGVTFTKVHCWTLTQYSKCVFLDADTLVIQNCDELMERDELSAAPDPGWPDCFNSGVFVFVPNMETFKQLVQFAITHGSFDGGDQGLLNMYFNDWPTSDIRKHLSFLYNMCSTSTYTYLPALNYYGANIKIVHFIGTNKPWLLGPSGAGLSKFTQAWWDCFQSSVVQNLSKDMREYNQSRSDSSLESLNEIKSNIESTSKKVMSNDQNITSSQYQQNRYKFTDPWSNVPNKTNENRPPDKPFPKIIITSDTQTHNRILQPFNNINYSKKDYFISTNAISGVANYNDSTRKTDFVQNQTKDITTHPQTNSYQNTYVYRLNEMKKTETNEKVKHGYKFNTEILETFKKIINQNPTNTDQFQRNNVTVCEFNTNDAERQFTTNPSGNQGSQDDTGLAGALGSKEKSVIEEQWRKQNWEQGNIDFTGKDCFENIWQKIMGAVNKTKAEEPKQAQPKVDDKPIPLVPKEIASQAIPEKEKADIPLPIEAPKEPKKDGGEAPIALFADILKKQESVPKTTTPIAEVKKLEQPIPLLPPTSEVEKALPKLPEAPISGVPEPEALKKEMPPPAAPIDKPIPAKEEKIVPIQPPVSQQIPAEVKDLPPQSQASGDLPKIEDILKGLEQQLTAQLQEEMKEAVTAPLIEALKEAAKPIDLPIEQKKIEEIVSAPLPELAKPEEPKQEAPKANEPKVEALKVSESKVEAPKASEPKVEAPKSGGPKVEAPKAGGPKVEAPKASESKVEVPKASEPKVEVPKASEPKVEVPKASEPKVDGPKASEPKVDGPKTDEPKVEAPKTEQSQVSPPKVEAPKPEGPLPEAPKAELTKPDAPKVETPKPEEPKLEKPKGEEPKAETPKADIPKPEGPKVEAPKVDTPKPDSPKPQPAKLDTSQTAKTEEPMPAIPKLPEPAPELLKSDKPIPELPKAETPQSKTTDLPSQTKPTAPPPPAEASKGSSTQEISTQKPTVPSSPSGKKQKTPPKDQKSAKQQAPQPPPKNGKQKQAQQPEPTLAHPLAEQVQPESAQAKEGQKPLPQAPLTPPTSPDANQPKLPDVQGQPGTPIVTAPTPPVSPLDAPKKEDPLSAQIKSVEGAQPAGASTPAPVEVPVPPKRKGKGNGQPQPQKSQNNGGGKGKGKK